MVQILIKCVWRDFRLPMLASANGNIKYLIGKSIFAVNLPLKLSPATVANADIGILKSLHTLFDKYLDYILVKFEQYCMVQSTQNFSLFDKKKKETGFLKPFFNKALTPFWKTFLLLKHFV